MRIVKCDLEGLSAAADVVRGGGVVVYPTDTVYGLGCDPYDEGAVKKVFSLKGRGDKPVPVLCSSLERAKGLVYLQGSGLRLASRLWPGPLTLVSWIHDKSLPQALTLGSPKLGVRVPNHEGALKLVELCGGSLVGTSANRSGLKAPRSREEVLGVLEDDFDMLVDGGRTPLGKESTVVDATLSPILIVREGFLKGEEVRSSLQE